jgi:hypothetical protein
MSQMKETYRDVEQDAKKVRRDIDGHDLGDDLGNAGDEIRKDLGNAGDTLRDGARDPGREIDERTGRDPLAHPADPAARPSEPYPR